MSSSSDLSIDMVIEDWELLRREQTHTRTGPASKSRIGTILRFVGLPYEDEKQIVVRSEGRPGNRWMHFTFQADPQIVNSIKGAPRFGSQANGTYQIFCLWEDARPDRICRNMTIQNLAKGNQAAVIVIYLNALTDTERQEIRHESWVEDLTIAIVDEMLLAFLTRTKGNRFGAFLELTLPFTASNPYNPETAGWGARVAREMFYGREQLARDIAAMRDGTSLVFGGRQLGKTALTQESGRDCLETGSSTFCLVHRLEGQGICPVGRFSWSEGPSRHIRDPAWQLSAVRRFEGTFAQLWLGDNAPGYPRSLQRRPGPPSLGYV